MLRFGAECRLNDLTKYNQKVLFPALDNKFAKIDDKFASIDDRFGKVGERFNKIDERFDKVDEEIREKFDKVLTGQDKILKELVDMRTENTINASLYQRQDGKLENHEIRIQIVEELSLIHI